MKLKKIENAVVHCKTKEEAEQLINSVAARSGKGKGFWLCCWNMYKEDTCYEIRDGVMVCYGIIGSWDNSTEFADLIEPDLTAEEAIEWICKHYHDGEYENAFGEDYTIRDLAKALPPKEIAERIAKWKAEHEKKEPEVECVSVCRIYRMDDYGRKEYVFEEKLLMDREIGRQMADILKRYIASHEGNFMAVQELIYRVKKG